MRRGIINRGADDVGHLARGQVHELINGDLPHHPLLVGRAE